MKKPLIILSLFTVLFVLSASAQDKIYKKKGEVLKVKVIEVGVDELKYRLFDDPTGPIYVIDKASIQKVVLESGKVETYKTGLNDPELYADQRKHALKVGFLSPLSGYLPITYEKNLGIGKAMELTLGIIGAGKNQVLYSSFLVNGNYQEVKRDQFGFHFAAGYKFNKLPTYFNRGVRMTHVMQGFYVRPTFNMGFYKDNAIVFKNNQQEVNKRKVVFGALTIDVGQQWIFSDRFVLDVYVGLGYAFDNVNQTEWYDYAQDHFPIKLIGETDGLGLCSGLKVGWLIK